MKTKINGILTLLLVFMVQMTFAQERTISGVVSDEMGPVADISVKVKGTTRGTVTDFDGNYAIKAKTGDVIEFTHVSYATVTKTVGASSKIDVMVKESGNTLEEVVIHGAYDITRTKPKSVSAISTVSASTIENRPNASAIQTLQGQTAGLSIVTGNGQPGAASAVTIRGYGSVNGKTEPLVVLDGVIVDIDHFKSINPNEFESVSVLKDAGATAIYGNRGANGAIVITTKKGKYNSPLSVDYSFTSSFSDLQGNKYDLKDSYEQLHLEKLYGVGYGSNLTDAEILAVSKYANTNWQDVFFRTGFTQKHNLSLRGGGKKTSSFTSLSFMNQDGILKESDLKRFNLRSNVTGKSNDDKFNYGTSISLNYSNSATPNSIGTGAINRNYILGAYMSVPYVSPHQYIPGNGANIPVQFYLTPIMLLDRMDTYKRNLEEVKIMGSINASYKLAKNLVFSTRFSTDYRSQFLTRSESPISFNAQLFAQVGNSTPGFQEQQSTRVVNVNSVNSLSYTKTIKDIHEFKAAIYTEYYKAHYREFGFFEEGLDPKTFYHGDGSGFIDDNSANDYFSNAVNAQILNSGLFSYFATLDYDLKSKYGLSFVVRRDASHRFRKTNRWGTFWSVAGRWNIDKEDFMKDSFFDMLKLRGSYGVIGNQYLGGNSDFNASSLDLDLYATGSGYQGQNSLVSVQTGNLDLGWEKTSQSNIGLDFRFLSNKLDGGIDVYKKVTTDLFEDLITNSTSGEISQRVNGDGSIVNQGIELHLAYSFLNNDDGLNAKLRFVGDYNKNQRFLAEGQEVPEVEDGGKLFQYYDIRYAGVNPENGNQLFLDKDGNLTENPTDNDRVFLGLNSIPDYQGSFGLDLDYKGFYLTTQFNFVVGTDRYDNDYADLMDPTSIGQFRHSNDIDNAWTPTNRETNVPSLTASNLSISGTRFLQSSDYLRLRFVNFGYSVPSKYLEKFKIKSIKAFLNGENLYTFSGWRGYDAEGFGNVSRTYPTPKTISLGLELKF